MPRFLFLFRKKKILKTYFSVLLGFYCRENQQQQQQQQRQRILMGSRRVCDLCTASSDAFRFTRWPFNQEVDMKLEQWETETALLALSCVLLFLTWSCTVVQGWDLLGSFKLYGGVVATLRAFSLHKRNAATSIEPLQPYETGEKSFVKTPCWPLGCAGLSDSTLTRWF